MSKITAILGSALFFVVAPAMLAGVIPWSMTHWQFEGDDVLPEGLSSDLVRKIMIDNPLATYGRLQQVARETTP